MISDTLEPVFVSIVEGLSAMQRSKCISSSTHCLKGSFVGEVISSNLLSLEGPLLDIPGNIPQVLLPVNNEKYTN